MDTSTLVRKAQAGDRASFERLVVRHQNLAHGYAFTLLGDFQRAEDAAQESFIAAYKGLSGLRDPDAFPAWLRGIVFRTCGRVWRARRTFVPFEDVPEIASSTAPTDERLADDDALEKIMVDLSPQLREVITLFYLQDRSQRDVAAFLGLPESTVVTRLHKARKILKGRYKTMIDQTLSSHKTGAGFVAKVADILNVQDWLVEARMTSSERPQIFDIFSGAKEAGGYVVIQRGHDGKLICLAQSTGAKDDRRIIWKGSETSDSAGFSDQAIRGAVDHLKGQNRGEPKFCATGIKVLDLFCPLRSDGVVGLFGTHGVGRLVIAQELVRNLGATDAAQSLVFFVSNWDVPGTQDTLANSTAFAADIHGRVKIAWMIAKEAVNPHYGSKADYVDTRIFCSPALAARGHWPAVDPLHCASKALDPAIVGAHHAQVANDAYAVLRRADALMKDATFFEFLALGAVAEAKSRFAEVRAERQKTLNIEDRTTLVRAERIEAFMTQPFHVMGEQTGMPGVSVAIDETLNGCQRILAGEFDAVPAQDLFYKGALPAGRI